MVHGTFETPAYHLAALQSSLSVGMLVGWAEFSMFLKCGTCRYFCLGELVQMNKDVIYLVTASLCAIFAAGFDLKIRKIPNLITGPAFIAGLLIHLSMDGGRGMLDSLAAGVISGLIFLVFYIAGGMGAGDVKLIAAVACIAGFGNISYLLIFTALAGGVMGVGLALIRGQFRQTLHNVLVIVGHHRQSGLTPHADLNVENNRILRLPYGLAIAVGSMLTLCLQSSWRAKL